MKIFRRNDKVFCIGRNKTGTTTMERVLTDFGFSMGSQAKGELLVSAYAKGNFNPIVKLCKTADAFQDAPFSWPYTWLVLHEHFPKAKFILTLRDEEAWYHSLTSFHSKLFADGERTPNKKDLQNASYRYKGFIWEASRAVWRTPENDVYNKELMLDNYRRHNEDVLHYFKDKPNFIAVDVSKKEDYFRLCTFLNKKPLSDNFPHLNKTKL